MSEHESILAIIHQKNQAPLTLRPERTAAPRHRRAVVLPGRNVRSQLFERLSPGVTGGYLSRVRDTVVPNIRRLQEGFRA